MNRNSYLGMRPGDLDGKPYAKYWMPEMKPMQPQVQQAILHGSEAAELGLTLDQADHLMQPGYLPLENGTTQLANGQVFIAVQTLMPRVTGAMFEWWMGWHYMEPQRYKLWHPKAHLDNGTREMRGDDPDVSDKEKYMTNHYVTEYIGNSLEHITITFVGAETLFTQSNDLSANNVSALVCGRVSRQKLPGIIIGHIIHQIRQVDGGAEMRSRFWLGKPQVASSSEQSVRNKVLGSKWIARKLLPPNAGRDMLVHCGMEMNQLAGFLPDLYADYHPDT